MSSCFDEFLCREDDWLFVVRAESLFHLVKGWMATLCVIDYAAHSIAFPPMLMSIVMIR
jgi:hypothetical protein